jgi:phospholipid/cholesterol/gamma-HCH transport system ATP-binding protein
MNEVETIEEKVVPIQESTVILEIRNLCKSFGDNHVLTEFNLKLIKGENVAVLGKSGSGKSVLIKCIIGLLKPDSGSINVLGNNIEEMDIQELDKVRTRIGFLFQSNALYDSMTVRENLEFPLRRHSISLSVNERNEKVSEVLRNVGLLHTIDMMPAELSGGMRKRIALARTLILDPEIILYDEPTTGLDPITGKEISNLIKEMGEKYNTSALIISHDMKCILATADRIIMLIDGKCYAQGTYYELKLNTDQKVKQFFE